MTNYNIKYLDYGKLAYDRMVIADALYRYAAGLDLDDADMLASSFTQDLHEKGSPPSMKKSRILAGDASSKIVRT
jgi:hypothetical protein